LPRDRTLVSPKKQKKIYPADPLLSLIPSLLRPPGFDRPVTLTATPPDAPVQSRAGSETGTGSAPLSTIRCRIGAAGSRVAATEQ
jgi:hypothetical protein